TATSQPSNSPTTPNKEGETEQDPQLPSGYAYLNTIGGKPVLVAPCQAVSYAVTSSAMPVGGEPLVRKAISMVGQMTGLETDTESGASGSGTVITISFKHEREDPSLAGNVIGVAHVQSIGGLQDPHISKVSISLEIEWFAPAIKRTPDLATMVVVHEILHGHGLDHVNDPTSIMYYSAKATQPNSADYKAARALNPGCTNRSTSSDTGEVSSTISVPEMWNACSFHIWTGFVYQSCCYGGPSLSRSWTRRFLLRNPPPSLALLTLLGPCYSKAHRASS
ncbi:MAG: matrixin family metalloprotease, partial [Propionibacteriaceae bacterium]|nr:matrixin family metalloprotease [Propionibacteriaceae bacterium]